MPKKRVDSTAGMGDPYWYEWSVGQRFVIEMLSDDSQIASVTLQQKGPKGLDDVVVQYASGDALFIQVKHTREGDTLTFGDLVSPSDNDDASLLKQIAECWDVVAKATAGRCEARLLTNRHAGRRSASVGVAGNKITRPALTEFLDRLAQSLGSITRLDQLDLPSDWLPAWKAEWLPQLDGLETDDRRLAFLRAFTIQTSEQGLEDLTADLVARLGLAFGVGREIAEGLLAQLDSALRQWSTSLRGSREAISKERAYAALTLRTERPIGDHELPPPAPFFPSRDEVVGRVVICLNETSTRIVFLTGEPGSGKTAVVSALANRREPVLDLRFHAYRPISPDNQLLPADAGATATARALWSDLLLQVRNRVQGRLTKFRVPVHAGKLKTDELRAEVLRIANLWGQEREQRVVIAVDGIDHAARSGSELESLLHTLVPPGQVPQHVVFLIAGQPAEAYPNYPTWLRCQTPGVERVELPRLDLTDTESLVRERMQQLAPALQRVVAEEVFQRCDGHTLATVFAVEEAAACKEDIRALPAVLDARRISEGIGVYYEALWTSAANLHELDDSLMTRLAACVALSPSRTNGDLLRAVMPEATYAGVAWTDVLRRLRPLVVEENAGFRLFHNDVRVFLLQRLHADDGVYRVCASRIADHFATGPDAEARHAAVQDLLGIAGRHLDQARLLTANYLIEGYAIGRPLGVMTSQALVATDALARIDPDWDLVHAVACGLRTLVQLRSSLQWRAATNERQRRLGTIPVCPAERVVAREDEWSHPVLMAALQDIDALMDAGENERAAGAFRRWFHDLSPARILAKCTRKADLIDDGSKLSDVGSLLGRMSVATRTRLRVSQKDDETSRKAEASYSAGILAGVATVGERRRFLSALDRVCIYYHSDIQRLLDHLLVVRDWQRIGFVLRRVRLAAKGASWPLRMQAAALGALVGTKSVRATWVKPLLEARNEAISAAATASDYSLDGRNSNLAMLTWMALLLGHEEPSRDPSAIRGELETAYHGTQRDERSDAVVAQLLFASASLGRHIRGGRSAAHYALFSADVLPRIMRNLMGGGRGERGYPPHGFHPIAKALVEAITDAVLGHSALEELVRKIFLEEVQKGASLGMFLDVAWRTLKRHGHFAELRAYAEQWLGVEGKAWVESLSERHELVTQMASLLDSIGEGKSAAAALKRLTWAGIGYIGRKEYALDGPLEWFERLTAVEPAAWSSGGLELLAVSKEASRTGDNRFGSLVESAVVKSACAEGVNGLDRLLRTGRKWMPPEDPDLIRGLTAHVQRAPLDQNDLLAIWVFCTGQLDWQRDRDGKLLVEARKVVLEAAERQGWSKFAEEMRELAPAEFAAKDDDERGATETDAAEIAQLARLNSLGPLEAMNEAASAASSGRSEGWKRIRHVLARLQRERPAGTADAAAVALRALSEAEQRWPWSFDGRNRTYRSLFPFLTAEERWRALLDGVTRIQHEVPEHRVGALAENLDCLCLSEAEIDGAKALDAGLTRWLATHNAWLTGAGHLPAIDRPQLPITRSLKGWSSLFADLLVDLLRFDQEGYVEASLRGLYRLLVNDASLMPDVLQAVDAAEPEVQRRFMLITERLAILEGARGLRAWLEARLDSPQLDTALAAWIALSVHARSKGGAAPEWPQPGRQNSPPQVKPVAAPLLEGPSRTRGLHTTAARPSASFLSFLSAACADDCSDIKAMFAAQERSRLSPTKPDPVMRGRGLGGDMISTRDGEVDRLMQLLREYERSGRFRDVPTQRLAQALIPAADPHVFLQTPGPLDGASEWPIDDDLDAALAANRVGLESRLAELIGCGVSDRRKVLAGSLRTFSRKWDVAVHLDHAAVRHGGVGEERRPHIHNGRMCFAFDMATLISSSGSERTEWFTQRVSGLLLFTDATVHAFPTHAWFDVFSWTPKPGNPLVWLRDDREVAWFERRLGPRRDIRQGDFVYRQPSIARWTCAKEEWERVCGCFPALPQRRLRLEHELLGKDD